MPDTTETRMGNGGDAVEQARSEVRSKVKEAEKAVTKDEEKRQKEKIADDVKKEVKDAVEQVERAKRAGAPIETATKQKLTSSLAKALEAANQGILEIPDQANELLTRIARASPSDSTASAISEHIGPYLLGDKRMIADGKVTDDFKKAFDELSSANPNAADLIHDSIIAQPERFGLNEEEAKRFGLKPEELKKEAEAEWKMREEKEAEQNFEYQWREMYGTYFQVEDQPLLKALFDRRKFIHYLAEKKEEFKKNRPELKENEVMLGKELSKEIKEEIAQLFAKVYMKVDREKAKDFFEQIITQDYFTGIQRVSNDLMRRISAIEIYCGAHEDEIKKELGENFKLYRDSEETPTSEIIKVEGKDKVRMTLKPLIGLQDVSLKEFVAHTYQVMNHYIGFREYTHNARAIFLHPPGEKGFYDQLAKFSENWTMVDYDEMMLLPGSEYFAQAFSLYDKFLDEQFATQDWQHTTWMFTPEPGHPYNLTRLESKVLEQLKNCYRDENGKLTVSEDRLISSLSLAVGAARGIFLNEPEKAAFAEPPLSSKGEATFYSYYTQDSNPLMAFNPFLHHFFRFQTQGSQLNPIYFLPIEGMKGIVWDHHDLWKQMQSYRDSFVQGRKVLGDQKLFADFCNNVGGIGGPFQRDGWRTETWIKPFFVYRTDDNTKIDHYETWKALENIGYEAIHQFVHHPLFFKGRMEEDFLKKADRKTDRTKLFSYLYDKYFSEKDSKSLENYLNDIRKEAREVVYDEIKRGLNRRSWQNAAPEDIDEQVELKTSKLFLYRTLARVLAQRIPTKFVRIDRDRFSPEGSSRWKKLRLAMEGEYKSPEKFDLLVKDLLLAESLLRREISKSMRDKLTKLGENATLNQITDEIDYKLSPDKIRTLLKGRSKDIDGVILLYEKLQDMLSSKESQFITSKDKYSSFLDEFAYSIQRGDYKFTFAIDEVDLSFIPFRGAGPRVLPRAIGDISSIEQNLIDGIKKFPELLQVTATNGKGDFSEIVQTIRRAKVAIEQVIGHDYAAEVSYSLAMMTINYFKKDTTAKGVFGWGRKNSLAAEIAGRSSAVWEWDARAIDKFVTTLETVDILKKDPYLWSASKAEFDPIYLSLPLIKTPMKLPYKINIFGKKRFLFKKRRPEIRWFAEDLRKDGGAKWYHFIGETLNTLLPIVLLFLLWRFLQEAIKEGQVKK